MKTLLSSLALLIGCSLAAQHTVQWSDSIIITSTTQAITAPRINLLKDGTPLATWGTSGNPSRIWCSRFENGAFSTALSILQSPNQPSLFGFGGYDVAVSDTQVFIVYEQLQQGIFITRSDDGGVSFGPPNLVQGPIQGGYATLASVAIDGTGQPIVSYIQDKNGAIYQIRRSLDGGLNFQEPVTANTPAPGAAVCECCTSDMTTSGDSIWIVFRNNNQDLRDIWVSRSSDLATTFDTAVDVDETDWNLNACPIAGPRMARSGDSLATVWMSSAGGINRVYLSTLHAGDMQFGQQLSFPGSGPQIIQSLPDLTASGDTLGVVFLEKSKEIQFYSSIKGAADLVAHNTQFAVPNHTLQYPSLAFRNGIFHLIYSDATADKVLYRQGKITQSSAILDYPSASDLKLYPNPTTGISYLNIDGIPVENIQLINAFGLPLQWISPKKTTENQVLIDLSNQTAGVYFIQIQLPTGLRLIKIIKA